MMPKCTPLDFPLLTLLIYPLHFTKKIRNVRLSTPGVRNRTVMAVSCNLTPLPGFDEFISDIRASPQNFKN